MKNSLRPEFNPDYAEVCNKLRIYRLPDAELDDEEDIPWQVDGIDTSTDAVSDWVYNFSTFKGAIFALPHIAKRHGVGHG